MTKMTMELNQHQIPLTLFARIVAEEFSQQQSNPQKAQQVYRNTLAVFAVNTYLQCLGWITSLETSNSWNPLMRTLLDTGDLKIPDYGTVECRPVLAEERVMVVPEEVDSERMVYIAVNIEPSNKSARLLGFIPQTDLSVVSFSELREIAELPYFLEESHRRVVAREQLLPKLSSWLSGAIEAGWQTLDSGILSLAQRNLLPAPATSNFRTGIISPHLLTSEESTPTIDRGASRVKIWNLGTNENYTRIALVISLLLSDREEIDVSVKVCPTNDNIYLPQGLTVKILDETQQPILQAQTRSTNENVEFFLSGEVGEGFSIQAIFHDEVKGESFII